jgi:hypothetical protein
LWAGLIALSVFIVLFRPPGDDGLRHLGVAFGEARSWGEVYPFSEFDGREGYDPWFGHDRVLRVLAHGLSWLPLSRLGQQAMASKLVSAIFVLLFLYLAVSRSRLTAEVKRPRDLAAAMLLVVLLLGYAIAVRLPLIRPFAYGTFYLVYVVHAEGALRGALSSGLLFFFYPYLAAIYTVPAAIAHLLRGSRAFAAATLAATGLAVALQPAGFWGLLAALMRADRLRATLTPQIGEFASALAHGGLCAAVVALLLLALPRFSAEARRLKPGHLLALLFVIPSLKHGRYLLDAVLPLIFMAFGREALRVFGEPLGQLGRSWLQLIPRRRSPAPAALPAPAPAGTRRRSLLPLIVPLYLVVLAAGGLVGVRGHREAQRMQSLLGQVPAGALMLTEFNLQYLALYARPDLRIVPSSELGFASAEIVEEYRGFFNRGKVCPLARTISAAFFLESRGTYLDPRFAACLRFAGEIGEYQLWKIAADNDASVERAPGK